MTGLFSAFGAKGLGSKGIAKERLRVTLANDRAQVTPNFLEMLKEDMASAVSKYMEIDCSAISVNLSNSESSISLVASIPVRRVKRTSEFSGSRRL
ncbi:MAG: cell division topological specificity factor MinE [Firmicutes bacterium]|nr:cell division topological specificity factor MinE [Bacillota bacterium]